MSKFAVLLVLLVAGILPSGSVAMPRANILVILTDDQPTETFDYMPFLNSIKDRGRVFQNYFHTEALCCPSRTSILTGMYPHNSQVLNNLGAHGGYMQFNRQGLQNKTWAKVLNDAGYVTALQGKYLNGVPPNTTDVPAGWSDWLSSFQGGGGDYNFRVNDNGSLATFTGENYYTDVMATRAGHVIRNAVNAGKPFADFFPTHCPHKPQVPSHEYAGRFATEHMPHRANFDEADVSDKPSFIQNLPRLKEAEIAKIETDWRHKLECLLSVDDALKKLWHLMANLGVLDNTYVFLLTDNGYMQGEHRIKSGKIVPYVESLQSKLFVWGPDVVSGTDRHIVANIDIMPTVLRVAKAEAHADWADGRSLLPLLNQDKDPAWRNSLPIRGEPPVDDEEGALDQDSRSFKAILYSHGVTQYLYTVYLEGEKELYNLTQDPDQLTNRIQLIDPKAEATLKLQMDALFACKRQTCHKLENKPLPAPL